MPDVRLVDLDVIKRFSLAVRRDAVPAEELLSSLDASRAVVIEALGGGVDAATPAPKVTRAPSPQRARAKAPAAKSPAVKPPAGKPQVTRAPSAQRAPAKKAPAKKAPAAKKAGRPRASGT